MHESAQPAGGVHRETTRGSHGPGARDPAACPDPVRSQILQRACDSTGTILAALKSGRMKWQGKFLSEAKKNAIADYLAAPVTASAMPGSTYCARDLDPPPNPNGRT